MKKQKQGDPLDPAGWPTTARLLLNMLNTDHCILAKLPASRLSHHLSFNSSFHITIAGPSSFVYGRQSLPFWRRGVLEGF
jgi:hypothetical protein